jgi:hypothetical protein
LYADATDRVAAVRSGAAELKDDPDGLLRHRRGTASPGVPHQSAGHELPGRYQQESVHPWRRDPSGCSGRIRWWHDDILRLAGEIGGKPGQTTR